MPYLPGVKEYYDPVPGWQMGLGLAENIERARSNRAREIAEKFRLEQAAKNEAAQLEIQRQNAETNEKYRQAQLEDAIRQRQRQGILDQQSMARQSILDQQAEAQQKLPGAILNISQQPADVAGNFVLRPEFQEKRGINPQVILEGYQQAGAAPSQAILGELARPSLDAKQQMAIELIRERAANKPKSIGIDSNPLSRSLTRYNELRKDPDVGPEEIKTQQQLLQSFGLKNGSNVTFTENGDAIIEPGLPQATRAKYEDGMKAASMAMKLLNGISDDEISESFGKEAQARNVGQEWRLANWGLGHTPAMTKISQAISAVQPLVRKGIQAEVGAVTEGDVQRALLLLADFDKNTPEQAKQKFEGVKEIFNQSIDFMSSSLKKNPSVQKSERDAASSIQTFATPEEAAAANLPKGTKIIVNGRPAVWE